jgi:hypothetical protein
VYEYVEQYLNDFQVLLPEVLYLVVEVAVDGGGADVAVVGDVFLFHGVKGVLELANLDLGEEGGVDVLLGPDAADGGLVVEEGEVGIGDKVEEGLGGDEAIPASSHHHHVNMFRLGLHLELSSVVPPIYFFI